MLIGNDVGQWLGVGDSLSGAPEIGGVYQEIKKECSDL
jgi:hypothetical protein